MNQERGSDATTPPGANGAESVVAAAVAATTAEQVDELSVRLRALGCTYDRPVGDRWGNRALFTAAGGNYDHKLVELVTNMQDAVILRAAMEREGPDVARHADLFPDPSSAVAGLLDDVPERQLASLCRVELHAYGVERTRSRTLVFRDRGTGMTPREVVGSLLKVGSSFKDGLRWQLGAFGRGGLTTLPNSRNWVVVTRKQPGLLAATEDDLVTVAVVRWEQVGFRQTLTAQYGVRTPWEREGDDALPWSVPYMDSMEFEPGTHISLVGFEAEGVNVSRLGDERSIDSLLDTRLFRAVLPIELVTPAFAERADRATVLKGLGRRLDGNPRADRLEGADVLPLNLHGRTYPLSVRFFVFPAGDAGSRRRFVARDHALLLLSNGQVHAHWTASDFRNRTTLPKLADRVLVTVDTDALPLATRTSLFTADRTELLRSPDAVRLEEELIAFLEDWPDLRTANDELVRDAIRRSNAERSTSSVAERIGRAYQVTQGESRSGHTDPASSTSRRRHGPAVRPESELLDDPTELLAPERVVAVPGRTVGIQLALNAKDRFIPRRATLQVTAEHLDIDAQQDISVGELRRGRLRLSVAVPPDAEAGETLLAFTVPAWIHQRGGLGGPLSSECRLRVGPEPTTDSVADSGTGIQEGRAQKPPAVAMIWCTHESEPGWSAAVAGEVDEVPGHVLSESDEAFAALAGSTQPVPVLRINEEFAPLKAYAGSRARDVGDEGVARAKDRYAVGLGLALLLGHREAQRRRALGETVDDAQLVSSRADAARAVLAVLPDFDSLAKQAGLGPV